ncbi:ATP-dependent helicase HrpB [Paenibacillus thalictri]|uniref:ATP-dependent helicase HrpB n=1 Tax=Paenibacillus thalictri TaxID=2527873 RepID=A0A4Q9E015_9BACL|nr:ATP-dependent helicase HrpB [Paenibacillus thalictri]TBL81548.1 ATP-dependent helicase HrpB [Paenibacillus thalictri]
MNNLPIEQVLPELQHHLAKNANAVLVAAPGAGKTTRVPLALLNEPWLAGRRILMLEPRRLAARTAARYMASLLGEQVGETVGYRVRQDSKTGPNTRIEVITEGVLTRMLQEDPALEQAGIVIFDEFHERSLHADLGLALCLQSQELLSGDLKLLVMSATLEAEPVAALMNDAPIIRSEGRAYPVETHYISRRPDERLESAAVRTIAEAMRQEPSGDMLVFLPGTGEIRRVQERLSELRLDASVQVHPLHGSLTSEEQDEAISPAPAGHRKIVLATSIAETSLTVEGVRIVVDCGLSRIPRFSPRTGMTRLETVPVSRASADQRRGRAGRLGPGVCWRLWSEQEDRRLAERSSPEMLEADLAPLMLELAAWGTADPTELRWLDPPPAAACGQARELLRRLGALDGRGALTAHGRRMAGLGLHPRLAHMMVQAIPLGLGGMACEIAALLGERDVLKGAGATPDADVRLRLEALRKAAGSGRPPRQGAGSAPAPAEAAAAAHFAGGFSVDTAACRRVRQEADRWKQALQLPLRADASGVDACGLLLAFAYPDRIAQSRSTGRFLLSSGRGAMFATLQPLAAEPYLVAAELDDQGAESRIHLAAPVTLAELEQHFSSHIEQEELVVWDRAAQAVRARKRLRFGALLLKETPLAKPDPEAVAGALLQGIAEEGLRVLPWSKAARQLQQRLQFMHEVDREWPNASDEALIAGLADWLAPHLSGMKSFADLTRLHLSDALADMLDWKQRRELDEYAPTHMAVPSGSRVAIDYTDPCSPVLAVRLQEMFGLAQTPRIGRGHVPLTLHLLSPAMRPVQVTQDLSNFWKNTYFEIKKDLKGRYPKHYWPDDPTAAQPTNRVRPKPQ